MKSKSFSRVLFYSSATYLMPLASPVLLSSAANAQTLPVCTTLLTTNCTPVVIPPLPTTGTVTGTIVTPTVPVTGAVVVPVTGTITTATGTVTTLTGTVSNGTAIVAGPGLVGTSTTNIVANLTGNITTIGDNQPALLLATAGALTVVSTGTLSTVGDNADGARLTGGTVVAALNNIVIQGINSQGADIVSTSGPLSLTVNNVTTGGAGSQDVLLRANGNVTLTSTGILQTTGVNAPAIDIATNPAVCVTLSGGCNITTTANQVSTANLNSPGVLILAQGPTSVNIASLSTSGAQSPGLNVTTDPAACVIVGAGNCGTAFNVGSLTTQGVGSTGALITAAGPTSATVGTLSTSGANAGGLSLITDPTACVVVGAGSCATNFNVGTLTTQGAGATGILVKAAGPTSGTVNTLQTSGDQAPGLVVTTDPAVCLILGTGNCGTAFNIATLTTQGIGSTGALITASGPTSATVGTLRTAGANALGLSLVTDPTACIIIGAGRCGTNFTVGDLTTQGAGATGILVQAAGPTNGQIGTVQTAGTGANAIDISAAPAVCIILGVGGCNVTLTPAPGTPGNVTTIGNNSAAVLINAPGQITTNLGAINTGGNGSPGVSIITDPAACLIIGAGACTINDRTGSVTTGGNNSPGTVIRGAEDPVTVVVGTTVTAGANSPGIDLVGTGPITLTGGTVLTGGINSPGVIIDGDNDPVRVNCDAITTVGANSPAIAVQGTGTIAVRCGTLTTSGPASDGLQIIGGAGPINAMVTTVLTRGADSDGVQISGTGPIALVTGNVTTGGDGATGVIIGGGAGPVNARCANVVTTGPNSPGVDVAASGAITVICDSVTTSGVNSDGINVAGQTGLVTVTSGPVRTTGGNSPGIDVATTTGAQIITAGGVNVAGPGSDAIRAVATGCADININATSAIISAQGTGILASTQCALTITTQSGAPVSGALAGINATSGTGATITLNDRVSSTSGPAINVDGAAARINVNAGGSIIGRIDLTDNADVLNNAGLFQVIGTSDFRGGNDVFNNLAGGTLRFTDSVGTLANCETFNNAGTITMVNGVANNTLSICGNYVGSGAANLGIDVGITSGGLISDRLNVGGNASGSTVINPNLLGALVLDPDGVLVVDAATATGSPFTLGGRTNFGLIDIRLLQTGGDTFLVALPNIAAIEPVVLGGLAQNLWYQSADIYSNYSALRRSDFGANRSNGLGIWGQVYYSQDKSDRQNVTFFGNDFSVDRFKTKRSGAQAGIDYLVGSNALVGITAGYERADADIRNSASDFRASGYNIGGYAMFGSRYGFYGDGLIKYDRAKLRFDNMLFDGLTGNPRLTSFGVQGQFGYRFGTDAMNFDLGAGIAVVRSRIDDFSVETVAFDFDRMKSTRGHLGARATFGNGALSPFIDAKVYREFNGDTRLALVSGSSSNTIVSKGRGAWARIEAGIGAQNGSGPILAAWGDFGDVKGFGAKAGWRFGGSREALALAPPPPPPPPLLPAPATQTCADGSVVLATDLCPSPPPPPPPPAPDASPERG